MLNYSQSYQNQCLQNQRGLSSIASTTSKDGHRTCKTCGFFVSQISPNGLLPHLTKFAVRLISRDKADCIRTNKASRSFAVVETVSHLSAIYPFHSLTKQKTMNKPIQTPNGRNANATPIVISSRIEGVQYA